MQRNDISDLHMILTVGATLDLVSAENFSAADLEGATVLVVNEGAHDERAWNTAFATTVNVEELAWWLSRSI